jgi:hypothetical protein
MVYPTFSTVIPWQGPTIKREKEIGHKQFSVHDTLFWRGGCFDPEHKKFSKVNPHPSTIEVEALEEEAEEVLENDQETENDQGVVDVFTPISEEGSLNVTLLLNILLLMMIMVME